MKCKLLILTIILSWNFYTSGQIVNSYRTDELGKSVVAKVFEDTTWIAVSSSTGQSEIISLHDTNQVIKRFTYSNSINDLSVISKQLYFTSNFTSDSIKKTAIVKTNNPLKSISLPNASTQPLLFKYGNNKIAVIDNYKYSKDFIFPRITILNLDLTRDTSFVLPLNEIHRSHTAIVNNNKEIIIAGSKGGVSSRDDSQHCLIVIDSTYDLKYANTFGFIGEEFDSAHVNLALNTYPQGYLVLGQTKNSNNLTSTNFYILNNQTQVLATYRISTDSSLHFDRNAILYNPNNQQAILHLKNSKSSRFEIFSFDLNKNVFYDKVSSSTYNNSTLVANEPNLTILAQKESREFYSVKSNYSFDYNLCEFFEQSLSNIVQDCTIYMKQATYFINILATKDKITEENSGMLNEIEQGLLSFQSCPKPFKPDTIFMDSMVCPDHELAIKIAKDDSINLIPFQQETLIDSVTGDTILMSNLLSTNNPVNSDELNIIRITVKNPLYIYVKQDNGNVIRYKINVLAENQCIVPPPPQPDSSIEIYNYISPYSLDSKNDFFRVELKYYINIPPVELTIFNSSNRVIFETANYLNDWNGTDISPGEYYYIVRVKDQIFKGSLFINPN